MSPDGAAGELPARLRGIITFCDASQGQAYLQDATGGLFLTVAKNRPCDVAVGSRAEVEGVTAPGSFAPVVVSRHMVSRGRGGLPQPVPVTYEQLASSRYLAQFVQIRGVVQAARIRSRTHRLEMQVAADGGLFTAVVPNDPAVDPGSLAGARVRLRGVCGGRFNSRRQWTGFELRVPALAQVEIEEAAPADPYATQATPIAQLLVYTSAAPGDRLKVAGVVTAAQSGQWLYLRDQTGALRVETTQNTPLRPGDRVEVVGFAAVGDSTPALRHAIYRNTGSTPAPLALSVEAGRALNGNVDAELVSVTGILMDRIRRTDEQVLMVQSAGLVFNARMDQPGRRDDLAALRPGSRLRLTGICQVHAGDDRKPRSFELLLRGPGDVALLGGPPWWTLSHTLWTFAIMSGLVLAGLVWVCALRRQVRAQTGVLRQKLEREAALEERYRDLFENANDLVFTWDLQGRLTSLNRSAERISGYSRDEAIGIQLRDLVAAEQREPVRESIRRLAAGASLPPFNVDLITKSGTRRTLEISAHLLQRRDKEPEFEAIGRDITERTGVEAELKHAKEAAETANSAKSEFLANMSHEIRTPLNGLMGMTELALATPLNGEQREYLGTVKGSAELLLNIINEVLDFSKIESGKLALDPAPFEVRPFLEESVKSLAVRAGQKGLAFVWDVRPDVPEWLVGDALRLQQVLVNLIGNAVKFTERGGVSVVVEGAGRTALEFVFRSSVADTGIGIPRDKQARVFEAFVQADGSTTRRYGGTGLGLAISSRLVALMGGSIHVESEAGVGSAFRFTVRLGILSTRPGEAGSAEPLESGLSQAARSLRILLAEDNAVNQRLATLLLEKQGHAVVVAANGVDALEALGCHAFDLVLMDVQMPVMDGLECARAIRERERGTGCHIPILAMTAHALKPDRERCLAAGMDGYVSKPVRVQELMEAIERAVAAPVA